MDTKMDLMSIQANKPIDTTPRMCHNGYAATSPAI